MNHIHLGRSGLKVSPLCLGTMNFGPYTTEKESFAVMDRALELGVNFFDTADVYGGKPGEGVTEHILGRWFKQGDARRERVVLATKIFGGMEPRAGFDPNLDRGLSARKIIRGCEGSLRRMQTDCIDLYQMHHVDRDTPWDEIWEAMEVLRHQGKILYVGSSNFAGWHIAKAQESAARRHFMGLVCEQSLYNLFVREVELEVIPAARDYGLGVIAWSPLHGGLLGGILRKQLDGARRVRDGERAPEALVAARAQIQAYEDLCAGLSEEPGTVALAWLLRQPGVTGPIVGPRTMAQLEGALRALDVHLDDATVARLDDLFPGRKPAPEDYAW